MPRKQQNPHAELCAWANGLRPDSPQNERANMSKHTPGPWASVAEPPREIRLKRLHWTIGSVETRKGIAYVFGDDEANAKLIAAAPELLEKLDQLTLVVGLTALKHEHQRAPLQHALDEARAAIAKATA